MKTLPQQFIEMISRSDIPEPQLLLKTLADTAPSVSVRWNPAKPGTHIFDPDRDYDPVAWSNGAGQYLPERPDFTLDPRIHGGAYYVQDASSMILSYIVSRLTADGRPVAYADACAAPGGKTTCALSALPGGSLVVANEYVPSRAAVLRENLTKWGYENVVVSVGDTSRFSKLKETFDIIASDVPCSGEGMMRKDDEAVAQWSPGLVEQCAERQWEIICNLWPAIKPGGYLIYSTCTFNTRENEEMVARIVDELGGLPIDMQWPEGVGIVEAAAPCPGARFMPHRLRGEGLFVCVIRKPGHTTGTPDNSSPGRGRKEGSKKQPDYHATVLQWASPQVRDTMTVVERDGVLRLFPNRWLKLLTLLDKSLKIISTGIEAAEIKGRDLVPSHPLAMWRWLDADAFPRVGLDRKAALDYLRRESPDPALFADVPKGFVAVTYDGLPLGLVKHLGNRVNNLYPKEWRILHR